MKPVHDLSRAQSYVPYVRQALENPTEEVVYFSAQRRSINCVIEEFQLKGRPMGFLEAKVYILEAMQELVAGDFSHSHSQWDGFADVYGVVRDEIPWFIKFMLGVDLEKKQEYLEQISFHRPEKDLKLANGKIIKTDGKVS